MRQTLGFVGVLVVHTALLAWLTWPLAISLDTQLPATTILCRVDAFLDAWNLAWQSHALATAPTRLLDGDIYHPTRLSLLYGDFDFSALPYFAPTFLATGNPALALNVLLLGCLALTATALHLVVARWTGSHAAGLVAGASFLTAPWVLWTWVAGNPIYAVLQYLPPLIYTAATPRITARRALLVAALALLQSLASVLLAVATLTSLGALAAARLVRPATRRTGFVLAGLVAVVTLAVAGCAAGFLIVRGENPQIRQQTLFPSVVGLAHTVIPWGPFARDQILGVSPACWVIVGGGALAAWFRRAPDDALARGWRHASFWLATGVVLSLMPVVHVFGRRVALPTHRLALALGFYGVIRDPSRLAVPALVALALLTGVAFGECIRRLAAPDTATGRTLRVALLGLALFGILRGYTRPIPFLGAELKPQLGAYPTASAPSDRGSIIEHLRAGEGPVLELPIGPFAYQHAEAMYRAIFHGRPILNGYSGYWPAAFPERMALACALPNAAALARLRRETGVAAILVDLSALPDQHAPARGRRASPYVCPPSSETPSRQRAHWWAAFYGGEKRLRPLAIEGNRLLFAVVGDR